MEYFDFTAMWEEFLTKDDSQLNESEIIQKEFFKDTYQKLCQPIDGKIPKDIAETLMEEFKDSNYAMFVHKTGKVSKEEVFEKGLRIFSGNNLEKTSTRYSNSLRSEMDFFEDIATAYEYKNSNRAIILKVPITSFWEYEEGKSKPILMDTNEPAEDAGAVLSERTQKILLPEYILGSVELEDNKVKSFERNPNYKKIHNHSNDGLVCASQLIENIANGYQIIPERLPSYDDITVSNFIAEKNNEYMKQFTRDEAEIKAYSKKDMLLSKFNHMINKIKNFFTKDKNKEENSQNVDK